MTQRKGSPSMVSCEFPDCPNEASGRCSQNRYPCGKVYCIQHFRAVRGIIWCDLCWEQRADAEHRQELRGKRAERALWTIGAVGIVLGYGSTFLFELWNDGKLGPLTVFGGTVVSGACFIAILLVWFIREWLCTPPSDR